MIYHTMFSTVYTHIPKWLEPPPNTALPTKAEALIWMQERMGNRQNTEQADTDYKQTQTQTLILDNGLFSVCF